MEGSVFKKLILVTADTSGLKNLGGDLDKANMLLAGMGKSAERATSITTQMLPVMNKYGKESVAAFHKIATESGKTFTLMQSQIPKTNDFVKALQRVVVVVPMWMAARAAMQSFLSTIGDSAKYIVNLDKTMARIKSVIQGITPESFAGATVAIQNTVRALTLMTGKNVKDVGEVFYRVAERGIDARVALAAMNPIMKLSVGIMGDSTQTATVLAQTYDLLGASITENISESEKFTLISGVIANLWQKNAFELNEFNSALQGSGTTLKAFGVGARESMALIATFQQAGLKGAQASTAVNRIFADLVKNSTQLAKSLGIVLNPNIKIDSFKLLETVLQRINTLGDKTSEKYKAIYDIFEKKGAKGILALLEMPEKFTSNLEVARKTVEELSKDLDKFYELQLRTIEVQGNITKALYNEIGNAFLIGITNTTNIIDAQIQYNKLLREAVMIADVWGQILTNIDYGKVGRIAAMTGLGAITGGGLPGALLLGGATALHEGVQEGFKEKQTKTLDEMIMDAQERASRINAFGQIPGDSQSEKELKELKLKIDKSKENVLKLFGEKKDGVLTGEINQKLFALQSEQKYIDMEYQGYEKIAITNVKINDLVNKILETSKNTVDENGKVIGQTELNQMQFALLSGNYKKLNELVKQRPGLENDVVEVLKLQNEITKENMKLVEEFSNKLQGATKNAFKDLLSGKSNTRGFFDQISTFYRETSVDTVSDMLSKNVIGNSGIGQAFGQMMATVKNQNPIEKGFSSGAVMTYNAIVKGFSDGNTGNRTSVTGVGLGGGGLNLGIPTLPSFGGSTLPNIGGAWAASTPGRSNYWSPKPGYGYQEKTGEYGAMGGNNWYTPPLGGIPGQGYPGATERVGFMDAPVPISPANYYRGAGASATGGGFMSGIGGLFGMGGNRGLTYANVGGMGRVPVKPTMFQQMGGWGGMGNMAMGAIGIAQSRNQVNTGLSNAMAGASLGMMLGPIGAILGGVIGYLIGKKKKTETTTESSWQPEKAPEIQPTAISGGIASLSSPYPLIASRYFSGQQGSKERKNITISIGKIEGANSTEIADKVIERINTEYSRELGRGLSHEF